MTGKDDDADRRTDGADAGPYRAAQLALANVAVAAAFAVGGFVGVAFFAESHPGVTLIWLPSGLALATLVLRGPALATGVAIGAVLVGILSTAGPAATGIGAVGAVVEAGLGA